MSDLLEYELRPLALPECELVAAWADSPEEGQALGVPDEFPLTADTVAAWTYEVDYAFTLRRQGDLAAYGEITEDPVEQDVEISRVLVAPDMRGRGVGRALLLRLCAFLSEARPYPEVWLRAPRGGAALIACAHSVGFEDVPKASGPRFLWMKKTL